MVGSHLQLRLRGEVRWVGMVGCERAPLYVAEEVRFVGFFHVAGQVVEVAVVVLRTRLGGSGDEPCVFGVGGIENALRAFEHVA